MLIYLNLILAIDAFYETGPLFYVGIDANGRESSITTMDKFIICGLLICLGQGKGYFNDY